MTPAQTSELLAFCAAFDRRTVGKADVLAWQTVLADIDYDAARGAVSAHYADETRWIMPADIRTAVRAARASTAADYQGPGLPAEIPDADPDDVPAYLAAVRAQRTRAADGQALRPRPVAELVAGVGREVPPPAREAATERPMTVACPRCSARIGRPCRLPSGRSRPAHGARKRAAREEARRRTASEPGARPATPETEESA